MKYPIQKWKRFQHRRKTKQFDKPSSNRRVAVPSFFTLMNLFSGFLAIISISEGRLYYAAWLIVAAGLFDSLDGLMARLSNSTSQFGIELDSIADVVSFGVAPGFLLYNLGLSDLHFIGLILSALPPLCGAVRLARFNVEATETKGEIFKGLPTPAQALMIAAFYLTFYNRLALFSDFENGITAVLIPLIILLSFLMVSTIPFDKVPGFERETIKKYKGRIALFLLYIALIIIFQEIGLMIVFSLYILKGLVMGALQLWDEAFGEG